MFSLGSSVHPQRLLFKHQLRVANIFICFNKNKNQGPRTHIISFFCWIGRDQFKLFMVDHYAFALFSTNILPFLDICPRRDWMCLKNDGICFSGIWEISFSQKISYMNNWSETKKFYTKILLVSLVLVKILHWRRRLWTRNQISVTSLSGCVLKILTLHRMLKINLQSEF